MRLLNTSTYTLTDFKGKQRPPFAILSHRWLDDEITFAGLGEARLQDGTSTRLAVVKVRGACVKARANQINWLWIDSCCINNASFHETSSALNSMFNWYKEAVVCYTYLSDIDAFSGKNEKDGSQHMRTLAGSAPSEWYQRGWTLQELLAPEQVQFYDRNWAFLGSRADLRCEIEHITGIPDRFLHGAGSLRYASVAQVMSWQARRTTTEIEDIAYSLIGILGVSLVPIYGEGRRAFRRLQEELLKSSTDESIFAWTTPSDQTSQSSRSIASQGGKWGLLAPWVDCFESSGTVVPANITVPRPLEGIRQVASGIIMPWPIGDQYECNEDITTLAHRRTMGLFLQATRLLCFRPLLYRLGGKRKDDRYKEETRFQLTLNCLRDGLLLSIQLRRGSEGNVRFWIRDGCTELGPRKGRQVIAVHELSRLKEKQTLTTKMQEKVSVRGWSEILVLQPTEHT